MSVRRWLISCPRPAQVASFSQESNSEFWETHQHGNSCDSAWTWWKLFLFLSSLFLPSSRALCQPVPPVCGALLSNPYVRTSFRGLAEYKRTFRLGDHRHVFPLSVSMCAVYEGIWGGLSPFDQYFVIFSFSFVLTETWTATLHLITRLKISGDLLADETCDLDSWWWV